MLRVPESCLFLPNVAAIQIDADSDSSRPSAAVFRAISYEARTRVVSPPSVTASHATAL